MRILITGGCGFIGSAVVRYLINETDYEVINIDKMTYAATEGSVASVAGNDRYRHLPIDICESGAVESAFLDHQPDAIMHLAAESHVDRSIEGPEQFLQTNVVGTMNLLQAARNLMTRRADKGEGFRFLHVSTDEVFGALAHTDEPFTESTPYSPRSPYSASKASADHLARAWGETYGVPVLVTNCSNNYGPFHFPEKLIPLVTLKAIAQEALPVYGTGENVRDWLFVDDHATALTAVVTLERSARHTWSEAMPSVPISKSSTRSVIRLTIGSASTQPVPAAVLSSSSGPSRPRPSLRDRLVEAAARAMCPR